MIPDAYYVFRPVCKISPALQFSLSSLLAMRSCADMLLFIHCCTRVRCGVPALSVLSLYGARLAECHRAFNCPTKLHPLCLVFSSCFVQDSCSSLSAGGC